MFRKLMLLAGGLLFVIGVSVALMVLLFYLPKAWAIEKQAADRSITVRVIDRDTTAPIAGARVKVFARYPGYSPFIMANVRSDERGYLATTDDSGTARIPLTYFLIKGLRCDRVMFPFIRDVRFADLPAYAEIRAWLDDYTIASARIARGTGPFIKSYDQDEVIEMTLRQSSRLNTTNGLLKDTHGRNYDGDGPSARTEFYYRIDPDKERVVKTRDPAEADFVVNWETHPYGVDDHYHGVPTPDDKMYKVIKSVETFGHGGVATNHGARYFEELGEVADLAYHSSFDLAPVATRPEFTLVVIRSTDGQRYAAVTVGPRSMCWVYPTGAAVFAHGRSTTRYTETSLGKKCREFDPNSAPVHRHW